MLALEAIRSSGRNGIVCLTGVSTAGHQISIDAGALNRDIVLENDIVFGSVNANRADYEAASRALASADRTWLGRLITREVPLENWRQAYAKQEGDVKTVLRFASSEVGSSAISAPSIDGGITHPEIPGVR
jgi:threonine dehydrogenase-like Zn-dependent dehydrogenase